MAPSDSIVSAVNRFSVYCDEIESMIAEASKPHANHISNAIISTILNGRAGKALQRLVPHSARKEAGLFFTNNTLAQRVGELLAPVLEKGYRVMDPACGAGDLLLACARFLPKADNLNETLELWGQLISGSDLHGQFVRAARLRLGALAMSFHPDEVVSPSQLTERLQSLGTRDGLTAIPTEREACIAVNPPFGHMQAPVECSWASGKIQIAAWFMNQLLRGLSEGVHVVAILPNVLCSGTRYGKWRNTIASLCKSVSVEQAGRFDEAADVDVFLMHAIKGGAENNQNEWPILIPRDGRTQSTVSDFFEIHVGSVVPHRDSDLGPPRPYLHVRNAEPWQTIHIVEEERGYSGPVFQSPFVAVRRTSSPSDRYRCVATVINERRPVAVENHLIVASPRDKSLKSCEQLVAWLKLPETNHWMNSRIRCRHLTVSSMRDLPCQDIAEDGLQRIGPQEAGLWLSNDE